MADLRVELYNEIVGHLVGTDRRTFDFVADENAIEKFGLGSTTLSESVPFELVANRANAGRRRNFFAELLPEGASLDYLAGKIRVSPDDVIALLAQFGRDVAGSVKIDAMEIRPPISRGPQHAETVGFEPSVPVRVLHLSRASDVCRWCRNRAILHLKHVGFGDAGGRWDPHGTLGQTPKTYSAARRERVILPDRILVADLVIVLAGNYSGVWADRIGY